MRYVDRSTEPEPACLKDPSDAVNTEKLAAIDYYTLSVRIPRQKLTSFNFTAYGNFEVKSTLRKLFKNKCAYCEGPLTADMDVEHFRPKGGVTEDDQHDGYWWLTHSWSNLLASCPHCNQSRKSHLVPQHATVADFLKLQSTPPTSSYGKANQFPIQGQRATYTAQDIKAERALLIDPTAEDPEPLFKWSREGHYSVVLPTVVNPWMQSRALAAIDVFALNRLYLVHDRTVRLNEMRTQAQLILGLLEKDMRDGGNPACVNEAIVRVRKLKSAYGPSKWYTAMVKAFVEEFTAALQERVIAPAPLVVMNDFLPTGQEDEEVTPDAGMA
jgi:uncharacterized protein (TIGR02646 family)